VKHLRVTRPLVFFDLETTGVDPASDRIVQIAVMRVEPGGERQSKTRRINPERPIPPEATAVHGIRDEDVRGEPTFRQISKGLLEFLEGADLAGFNIRRFDVPLLDREFRDCGIDMGLGNRRILDVMTIFHRREPRDLSAAVRFYLGREHVGAHGAEADVAAALEVLDAQLERYTDLPRTLEELEQWCGGGVAKFVWRDGEAVFCFGRHQGRLLREVARDQPDYLRWLLEQDFPPDARDLVERALRNG
jgi:DNA polymerase-3 subunit epsilon